MISGPLILVKCALVSFATALAIIVLPVPGGPFRRTPFGGSIPSLRKRMGCLRGNSIISRTFRSCSPNPPMSSYMMEETSPGSSSSTISSLMTISVSGSTRTMPLGFVETMAKGSASAKSVMPGMKIRSPATTGRLLSPLRAKPSIPDPNLTFCCLAITGLRTSRSHSLVSTFLMVTRSPRLTPAFLRMIPSIRMTPRLASSGLHLQTIAAVFRSPAISMTSPGFNPKSLSKGTLARPCPTSLGIAFATRRESVFSSSSVIVPPRQQY